MRQEDDSRDECAGPQDEKHPRQSQMDPAAPLQPGVQHERQQRRGRHGKAQVDGQQERRLPASLALGQRVMPGKEVGEYLRTDAGSSFDAHRLVHLADRHGLQDAMKERLFRARFTEGRLISDLETLVELAAEVGLDGAEARTMLAGEDFAEDVRDDELSGQQLGITGVPMFVADRAFGLSGAQPAEQLLALLEHAWEAGDGVDQPRANPA